MFSLNYLKKNAPTSHLLPSACTCTDAKIQCSVHALMNIKIIAMKGKCSILGSNQPMAGETMQSSDGIYQE